MLRMNDLLELAVHASRDLGRLDGLDLTNFRLIAYRTHPTALEFPGL